MWESFIESSPEYSETKYRAWYFCDNDRCANELAALVSIGIKRATTSLMLWYENGNEVMPEVNDVNIVTDWNGTAQCIIKTKKVNIKNLCVNYLRRLRVIRSQSLGFPARDLFHRGNEAGLVDGLPEGRGFLQV